MEVSNSHSVDIIPISLHPILSKVFGQLVLQWVNICIKPHIDDRQFGGMAGTCTTDVRDVAVVWHLHFENVFDKKPHQRLLLNLKAQF